MWGASPRREWAARGIWADVVTRVALPWVRACAAKHRRRILSGGTSRYNRNQCDNIAVDIATVVDGAAAARYIYSHAGARRHGPIAGLSGGTMDR